MTSDLEDFVFEAYAQVLANSPFYGLATRFAHLGNHAPKIGPLKKWQKARELPTLQKQRFRDWYAERLKQGGTK